MQAHLLGVLTDKLLHMGEHQDPRLRPVLDRILAQCRHDMALAGTRRHDHAWIASIASREPRIELIDGALLVVAEHYPTISAPSNSALADSTIGSPQADGFATISRLL